MFPDSDESVHKWLHTCEQESDVTKATEAGATVTLLTCCSCCRGQLASVPSWKLLIYVHVNPFYLDVAGWMAMASTLAHLLGLSHFSAL